MGVNIMKCEKCRETMVLKEVDTIPHHFQPRQKIVRERWECPACNFYDTRIYQREKEVYEE